MDDGRDLSRPGQVTHAFPTGVSFIDFDWISGSVPVHTASPPNLSLPTSSELSLDWVDGLARAGAPDSVVYRDDAICDPDAENESAMFEAWTPPATSVVTTTTPCLDMALSSFAVGASLVAWASDYDLAGHTTIAVARPGTSCRRTDRELERSRGSARHRLAVGHRRSRQRRLDDLLRELGRQQPPDAVAGRRCRYSSTPIPSRFRPTRAI